MPMAEIDTTRHQRERSSSEAFKVVGNHSVLPRITRATKPITNSGTGSLLLSPTVVSLRNIMDNIRTAGNKHRNPQQFY